MSYDDNVHGEEGESCDGNDQFIQARKEMVAKHPAFLRNNWYFSWCSMQQVWDFIKHLDSTGLV